MLQNKNINSRYFLFAALLGILVFIVFIFFNSIPTRIHQGQQGIAAIQLLDAIRHPLLAIEKSDLKTHQASSQTHPDQLSINENIIVARSLIKRYQEASRYNPLLAENVDALAILIRDWIHAKLNHPGNHKSLSSMPQHLAENHLRLLQALTLLAEGEMPTHHDIEQGQIAEHQLQWGGIILVSYLLLLIILFQRFRQREMRLAYQAVKYAQTKLQQRENHLALTLNSIGDAVIATDAQGRVMQINPVAEKLTGWQQNEAHGLPLPEIFRIVNARSREPVDNPVEKVLSSGKVVGLANHTVLIAKDDHEYQIADSGAPIIDEKGEVFGVILVFRDVSKEYQQQETLSKSQFNLAEAQKIAHIGNWELDLVSNTLKWSDEIFRIFEIDPGKFTPTYDRFIDSIHPDDRNMVNQAYSDSLEHKTAYNITHRLLMKDGRIKYVNECCKTDFDDNGQALRSIGVIQDLTKQKKIEHEKFKAASEWKQAMDSINDAIYLIDLDDRVIRANKIFYQLTGLKPEQVIGQDISKIMHPEGEPVPCPVCLARKAREDSLLVLEANHPDNPAGCPIEIMLRVIRNKDGAPISILMRVRDLSQQREIEDKLRQQQDYLEKEVEKRTADLNLINKELESFSYSISHDLRAPLRAINGFSVALKEDYADSLDETANNYLERISAGANRMTTLVDNLLMLSRINRQELKRNPCNLSNIANEIQQQLTEQLPSNNLQWKIQEQLKTSCDENLIHIALENMLSNAVKYSSKNKHAVIEFGCQQQDGKTVFYIRDNGVGFDMQYADKLFSAFQRLHGNEFEGTGIGLATVQRIIHRHGGKIWPEAKVDKGTTFYFTLE
ncbi:diguanylate cyclase/phosphodiesterase (GGDEF & EAL domains) with PAS/PAC sensor(s) [hydrothermal vent metagenome]|uniref:histidine kinase n=1 Tax=hydrothermal vent metagenome TaxID=652676 RepID=A0A3B1BN11_9ZZZZ